MHACTLMMKMWCCIVLLVASSPISLRAQSPQAEVFPRFTLDNTELRPLHSPVTGRDYLLYIGYPDSYRDHPERKYPVVYHTDAYWSFVRMRSIDTGLSQDHLAPEFILVGVGYAGEKVNYGSERMFELSPSRQDYGWSAGMNCRMGGARQFIEAFKKDIIPYVESHLRVDTSFRVLCGASMGGLFSLCAMYEDPSLFQGVIAVSPAVEWDHRWLFKRESELRAKAEGKPYRVPVRLFMSVGGAEDRTFVGGIKAMDQILQSAGYADFAYEFRVIDGEGHASNCSESFTRGIRFVFKKN